MEVREDLQKEILLGLKKNPHGRLLLAPRIGKTKLIIDLIKRDKPSSILWVSPSLELVVNGIREEFKKWNAKSYLKVLDTTTYASLGKHVGSYETIILDEEQHLTEDNSYSLLNGNIKYKNICSLTGVPTKDFDKQQIYRDLNLKILYNLSLNTAVDLGYLSNYEINILYVSMSTLKDIEVKYNKGDFKTSEADRYRWITRSIDNEFNSANKKFKIINRMRYIKGSKTKLRKAINLLLELKGRVLIFASTIKQADILCPHRYHSKTNRDDLEKFQSGEIERISMVNSGGTGFTYKKIDHLVITQIDSDRNGMSSQKIARCLLKQPNYKAKIWILCLKGTQDEKWLESTLEGFNKDKINYYDN